MTNLKERVKNCSTRASVFFYTHHKELALAFTVIVAMIAMSDLAFASSSTVDSVSKELETPIGNMVDIILLIFRIIGIILGTYSVGLLVMSFKDQDPNGKQQATQLLVISLVLIFLQTLVNALGLKDYITSASSTSKS